MSWGERIDELLERSGLSLRAYSAELGLSRETVRRWANGDYEPLLSLAIAVADAVGWPIDMLAGPEPLIGPVRSPGQAELPMTMTAFARSLYEIASARDLSLRGLAKATGIPSGTLLGWTQLRHDPTVRPALQVAQVLGLSLWAMASGQLELAE